MKRSIKETVVLFLKGGVIGVANIIPGVSGGTLAVILGIYDRLIEAVAKFFQNPAKRKEYIFFLAKIFLGAAIAILLLAGAMDFLLTNHYEQTMFLFMGLILGGIPAVVRSHRDMKIRTTRILAFVLGMIIVLGLAIGGKEYGAANMLAADATFSDTRACFMVMIAGFFAGGAMIVPGISGSFILVLMGQYAFIIAAIKELAVKPIGFMAVGAAVGILVFSKIIEACLEKIPALTYYFILGLIFASFYKIFPGLPQGNVPLLSCAGTFVAGTIATYFLSRNRGKGR